MDRITVLPPELLHNIFQWLLPSDLGSLPLTCKSLDVFVKGNQSLHHDVYLNSYDEPQSKQLDWIQEVHDTVQLEIICSRKGVSKKKDKLEFVHSVVARLLQNASSTGDTMENSSTHLNSLNATKLKTLFKAESNQQAFLQQSLLFERVRHEQTNPTKAESDSRKIHQLSAKLHCLYGKPILNIGRLRSTRTYPYACSKVYDLRQYTQLTGWGPFMSDGSGRVDWEKMEAILIVLGNNIYMKKLVSKIFAAVWDSPFAGSWTNSYTSPPRADMTDLDAQDPYGVTGTWVQIVCFLDYNDFFAFNFPEEDVVPADQPRPGLNVGEATRFIAMRVKVTAIEPPGEDDGQALPVVHFNGISTSLDDSWDDSSRVDVRGTVRLTKEGEVRWTTFSIFHGHERWRSEGIQIGGPKSARGVLGNWFDRDYDPHGPAGPTAFWKATDSDDPRDSLGDIGPTDYFAAYTIMGLEDEDEDSDPEAEMDYVADEDGAEEDDDEFQFDPENGEVAGLLMDAQMEVDDVAHTHN